MNSRQQFRANRQWSRVFVATCIASCMLMTNQVQATPATFTFTSPNPGWIPVRIGGQPVTDVEGDTAGARDIVGDASNPMLYIASDSTHLYFRLRLDSDPLQNVTTFGPFGWGCLIDTNSDPTTFEYSTLVDGVVNPDVIHFYRNTITTTLNDPAEVPDQPSITTTLDPLLTAVKHAQVALTGSMFGATSDYFMDWAIELGPALAAGFDPANPARYYCGSANNGSTLGADCASGATCGTLSSQFSDSITCGPLGCAICGDGQKGSTEGCDDGNTTDGDGCNSACLLELGQACAGVSPACASGFCDPAGNICACDSNTDCPVGKVCATTANPNLCVNPGCGNTVLEGAEGCDDGNTISGDGCTATCLKELGQTCVASTKCASGFCDPSGNICACDTNVDCPMGKVCAITPNPNLCVNPGCGNTVLEGAEGCDDGNTMAGDGCSPVCLKELGQPCVTNYSCASNFCDIGSQKCVCDQNADCPGSQLCKTTAPPYTCVNPGCGNSILEASEGCDDGNTTNGDGCNSTCLKEIGQMCTINTQCVSGFCDSANNTCACDQNTDCSGGQVCNTVANPNVCVNPGCGNFVVEAGESCDDGNTMAGDGCSPVCLKELGQSCSSSSSCATSFCDPANGTCQCDQNSDCPMGQLCNTVANPNVCVAPGCGNSIVESGEGCDDGNTANGDGCTSICLLEIGQTCTINMQCASQFCDTANNTCACDQNADCPMGQLCNMVANPNMCVAPGCGNSILESGEGCEDGNTTNGDGCTSICLREIGQTCTINTQCASQFCDSTNNTCRCDQNSDCSGGKFCNVVMDPNVCVNPGCGNFVLESGEGCDDGNTTSGDGCNSMCLSEIGRTCVTNPQCASGFCDPTNNTCRCVQHSNCPNGQLCNTVANPNLCVAPGCGNFVLEATEGCDDGNATNGDGCNTVCLLELGQPCTSSLTCASGFCDPTGNSCSCDQNADCPNGQICDTMANPNACVSPGCGNDVHEANEVCDDGNSNNYDSCSNVCLLGLGQTCFANSMCASSFCDPTSNICACNDNLDCPNGLLCNTVTNPNACVAPGCGNFVLEATEACDDGNMSSNDVCSAECLLEVGQVCDDSAACQSGLCHNNTCACTSDTDCPAEHLCAGSACIAVGCGDSLLVVTEICDDGNTLDDDGCDSNCTPTSCGNGIQTASEDCDDGNLTDGDGCSASCEADITSGTGGAGGTGGDFTNQPPGCACSTQGNPSSSVPFWMAALPLVLRARRQRQR